MGGCIVWSGNRIEIDSASLREIIKGNIIEKDVEFPTLSKDGEPVEKENKNMADPRRRIEQLK